MIAKFEPIIYAYWNKLAGSPALPDLFQYTDPDVRMIRTRIRKTGIPISVQHMYKDIL